MAITFTQEKKKQRYLLLVLGLVFLVTLFIIWWGFFAQQKPAPSSMLPVYVSPEIDINWQVLDSPQLEELQLFEAILPPEEAIGRGNPFLPY